ncbi:MAG: phosphatidate cytidylyltransferase [Verrucomicrobia bacterium]|nr:phosphatidate cytidylyltransferase [Verrucomicrobiota bacterium]
MAWSKPAENTVIAAGVVLGLLIIASVIVAAMRLARPDKDYRELEQRIKSWWMICVLMLGAILAGGVTALLLFAFVSYLALKEYFSLIPTRRADRRVLFWAYLAIPIQYWWVYADWYGMFIIFIPVYMFLIVPMRLVAIQDTKGFLRSAGSIHWGLMIAVFCLSHAAWLFALPASRNPAGGSAGLVLYLVGFTELNDIAQYLWGKSLGKGKILPEVSPKKTWVGFVGGVATTACLSGAIAPFLTPMGIREGLLIGAALAFFGFLGDVTVSALKRDLGIKDSGSALPGHGGILDRIDSLMFTAPLFVHYIRYYYYL